MDSFRSLYQLPPEFIRRLGYGRHDADSGNLNPVFQHFDLTVPV